jgi:lysophospholipase L1-like esterase
MSSQKGIGINRKKAAAYIIVLLVSLSIAAIIIETSLNSSNSVKIVRVACIGDSITNCGYPNMLQTSLGANYTVRNFGSNSSTVLLNTEKPYMYQVEFTLTKHFLPDIAVVMLGTNDARADHFKSIDNFVHDYLLLINELQALESKPKIFLVKPPPIFDNAFDLKNVNLVEGIIPRIEQIANQEGLSIIDVYAVLENHPEYFPDGVHPNSDGATIIANEVYNAILSSETS